MPSKCLGKTILSHSLPNFPENHKVLFFWFFPSERRPVWLWPVGRPRPNWVAGSTFGRAHAPKSSRQARPRQCADSTRPKTIFCTLSSLNRNSKFLQSESEKWRPVDHVRLRQSALSNCQIALYCIICKSLLWYFMHWYCRNDSQKLCIVLFCPVQNRTYDIGCHLLMTKTKTQRMFIIFTKIVKFSPPQIVNQDFPLNYYIFTKNCPPNRNSPFSSLSYQINFAQFILVWLPSEDNWILNRNRDIDEAPYI